MITKEEVRQLNAYVRYDGFLLGILLSASFIMCMSSLMIPILEFPAMLCMLAVPFLVGKRIGNYRDDVIKKNISYRRAWYYSLQCFLYGGLILAMASFVYMKFVDDGMFVSMLTENFKKPEMEVVLKTYGISKKEMQAMIDMITQQRPIDISFSLISNVLFSGFFLSFLIALFVRKSPKKAD